MAPPSTQNCLYWGFIAVKLPFIVPDMNPVSIGICLTHTDAALQTISWLTLAVERPHGVHTSSLTHARSAFVDILKATQREKETHFCINWTNITFRNTEFNEKKDLD
jgi:hypothetical protein